jgi:hypothetical protein
MGLKTYGAFPINIEIHADYYLANASNIGTLDLGRKLSLRYTRLSWITMLKSITAQSITAQSITAIAAAAIAASLVVLLTSAVPEAMADSRVKDAVSQPGVTTGSFPILAQGASCSSRGWPHYEQSCQFDKRRPINEARMVRVIALR